MKANITILSPFGDDEVAEVPLVSPPIELAIVQLRFPRMAKLVDGEEVIAAFATAMADQYPIFDPPHQEVNLILGPEGINQQQGSAKIWRLRSADENWSISVSATFLALESRQYPGRTELRSRLSFAIERFLQFARPPFLERVGVRYINRVHDEDIVRNLSKYVKPEVLGPLAAPIPSSVSVNHSINETRYVVDDQELQVRQGFVGPGLLHDPAIAPVKYPTWILDLDAFTHVKREFSAESVDRLVGELAARDYRYFRWAVTAEFLERFGGEHVS